MLAPREDAFGASYEARVARATALLAQDCARTHEELVCVARECVELDSQRVDGYVVLAIALLRTRHADDAVLWAKRGLELNPTNEALRSVLRNARLAVLNNLLDEDEDEEGDAGTEAPNDAHVKRAHAACQKHGSAAATIGAAFAEAARDPREPIAPPVSGTLSFETKVERLLLHLDLKKLTRLGAWYTLLELLQLRNVTAGITLLFLGILAQAVMHRHKFMVLSMLVICLCRSKLRAIVERHVTQWAHTSSDKLGTVTWIPQFFVGIPIAMKVFGHLKFMLFLQRDWRLCGAVAFVTGGFVLVTWRLNDGHEHKHWGHGKRLKFAAYTCAILYWIGWRGYYGDTLRLLAPALIDGGGIVLTSARSAEIQAACRRAWQRLFEEVSYDVQQDADFDAWFVLGLSNWVIDYWQQPTNFSLEVLVKMLADGLYSLERSAVQVFRPELHRLTAQMGASVKGCDTELALLSAYLRQSIAEVAPPKSLAFVGLFAKRCPSFVVGALSLVFHGTVSVALLPFLASEVADARTLYVLYTSGGMEPMDGLDVLLLSSPLLRVWENTKAAVYLLEGGVMFTKALATGTQMMTAAARLGHLARFACKVKSSGLSAHIDEVPDHITHAFKLATDYSSIAEGVRHLNSNMHLQDLCSSALRWWNSPNESQDA